jgi:hypothetical protein
VGHRPPPDLRKGVTVPTARDLCLTYWAVGPTQVLTLQAKRGELSGPATHGCFSKAPTSKTVEMASAGADADAILWAELADRGIQDDRAPLGGGDS